MGKLTVYCCYHDKSQKVDDYPNIEWFYGPDGLLNPYLAEFSMFYDIRKNDKDSDYIGTSHYRRRIYPSDFNENLVNEHSCQVYEIIRGSRWSTQFGIKNWATCWQCERLWSDYYDYVNTKYGKNNLYIRTDEILRTKTYKMIGRSSFILTKDHFMNMCDYIFGFLDYLNGKYNLRYDSELYDKRIMDMYARDKMNNQNRLPWGLQMRLQDMKRLLAYLFERMASIYVCANIKNHHLLYFSQSYRFPWTGGIMEYRFPNVFHMINNKLSIILNLFYKNADEV